MTNIDRKTFRNCILFFFGLSLLIYGRSITNGYAMDDEFVIHNNPQIHGGFKSIPAIFNTTYALGSKASYEYRPLVKMSYAIEYQLWGENPHISHFINILLYGMVVSLLFFLLLKLFGNFHYLFSFSIAALFLLHPLHSEVVMSLKNRDVLFSFTGCMLSLYFYLRFAEGKKWYNVAFGLFFMLFALMSKKDALPYFAVIPFTMWFFRNANWKKIGIVFLSYIPVLMTFHYAASRVSNTKIRTLLEWENPLFNDTTMWQRIPQGFYSIYFYLKMFIFPHPLVSYYGYNEVPLVGWSNPWVWIVIALLLMVGYFIIKNFRSKPVWIYGVLYFIITISMFLNTVLPVVGIVGERFAFIPSLGLCIVAVFFIYHYLKVPIANREFQLKAYSGKLVPLLIVAVLLYGGKTFSRNAAWKDAYTLYKTDAGNAPQSAHTQSLYAAAAIEKLKTDKRLTQTERRDLVIEARDAYEAALKTIPDYISVQNNLGMLLYTYMSAPDKAIPHLQRAVELDTGYVEAYYNLGACLMATRQYPEAEKAFLKVIQLNPNFTTAYVSLTNVYAINKQYDKILKVNQAAIDKGIKSDAMYVDIGNVYYMTGDTARAMPYLEKAIQFNPNNQKLNAFMASYYQRHGDQQKATYYYNLMNQSSPQ